jgi:hypothetical protein
VIDETTNIVYEYYNTYVEGRSLTQSATLYSSSADVAPAYPWELDVEKVANLQHTIDPTQLEKCPKRKANGKRRWKVVYARQIHVGTKEGTLSFNVVREGSNWGKTEIIFDGKQASLRRKPVQ